MSRSTLPRELPHPLTPAVVTQWMLTISGLIDDAIDAARDKADAAADHEAAYDDLWNAAYKASGEDSHAARKAYADGIPEVRHAKKQARKTEDALREARKEIDAQMARMSVLQTIAGTVREEHRFARTGPEVGSMA